MEQVAESLQLNSPHGVRQLALCEAVSAHAKLKGLFPDMLNNS
jgi:hypothetical protein